MDKNASIEFFKKISTDITYETIPNPYLVSEINELNSCDIDIYKTIVPTLIKKHGEKGLSEALITAFHDQALEKVEFLLENYHDQLPQEILNKALDNSLTTERVFAWNGSSDFTHKYIQLIGNPIYIYGNKPATKKNCLLIELLEKHAAKMSPDSASQALNNLADLTSFNPCLPINYLYELEKNRKFYNHSNSGCSQTRLNAAKFLLLRKGEFKRKSFYSDCKTACMAPCVQADLHRAGKSFTVGSALGFAVGCILCLPCNALATVRSCLPEETISLNLDTPPAAIRMDHQDSLEPALLTQQ